MPLSSLLTFDQCCALILLAAGPMVANAITTRRNSGSERNALVKLMLIVTAPGCVLGTIYGQLEERYWLMLFAWVWFLGWLLGAEWWRGERIARVDRTDATEPDTLALKDGATFTIRNGKPEQLP